MQCETTLYSFTALVGGQVGTAVITTGGFVWRAIGGVSSVTEVLASDIKKFQVTPSKSSKAILKFDREGEGVKPLTAQVVLTEDQRCGKSDAETATRCRVILEEARALIVNQKHWRCNAVAPSTASSTTSASSSSSSSSASSSGKPKTGDGPSRNSNPAGGWGRSLAGTVAPGGGGGGERTLVGPPAMEGPAAKKRRLKAAAKGGGDKLARAAAAGKVVGKSAHEAEEEACRMFLLSKDLELNRQFREMCGGEEPVMREDEFWESRSQQVASVRAARVGQREGLEGFWWRKAQEEQDAAFVEGSEGGGGGGKKQKGAGSGSGGSTVKLSLTKSDMAKVFVLYPAVQRLYAAKVPHEVGEVEFWTRFYRSKYLQLRSGGAAGGGSSSASAAGVGGLGGGSSLDGGLFAAVANSDSTPLARTPLETQALLSSVDPTLNLHDVYGDYVADPTCADVYERMVAREEQLPSERDIREQAERATVIAKYNRHALRLLQTAPNRLDPAVAPMSYRTAFHPTTAPIGDKTGAPTASSSSSSSSSVVVDDDANNPRGSAATTQHAAMAEVGAAGPAARAAARDELLEEATALPGLTKEGLRRAQTTSESGTTQIDVCGGWGANETIPLQLDKSYRRFAGGGEGPSSLSSSSEAVVESAGQNTTATATPATATSHATTSSNALGGSMMRCGAGQWPLPVGGNTAKGESTNAATTATAPVASFLPTFRAALDACDPDYAASLGGGGGVAGVAGGGDAAAKQSKSLLRKAQCVHELLRHLFALLKKARHLGHTQPKRTGDGGAGGGVACFELLAGEEKQKLARLEKRMVEVVGECRAEARNAAAKQAEEEALSSSSQAAHQTPSGRHTKLPAAMGGEVEVGLWRSLERQLQHGFAASEKIKHADRDDRARPQGNEGGWGEARTESTGGGGGGWEVVDSPRG